MADDTIEIEYQLTADDLVKFTLDFWSSQKSVAYNSETTKFKRMGRFCIEALFVLSVGVLLIKVFKIDNNYAVFENDVSFLIFIGLIFCMLFSFLPYEKWIQSCSKKKMMKKIETGKNENLLSSTKLYISAEGIKTYQKYATSDIKWKAVEKITIQNKDFCIFVSSVHALFVPSRFFGSEEKKQRIFEQCQKWFLDAQESQEEKADA